MLLLPVSLFMASGGLHNEHPLLIFWPVAGGWVAYLIWRAVGAARHRGLSSRGSTAVAIVFWLLSAGLAGLGLYQAIFGVDPHVLTAEMNTCSGNQNVLGSFLAVYAQTHQGKFPPTLNVLLAEMNEQTPAVFNDCARRVICPFTPDTPTTAPTVQAAVAALTTGGHCSYVYLGANVTLQSPRGTVLMYEPYGHHPHLKNITVLYTDGSVMRVEGTQAVKLIADLTAGKNPPSMP